MKTIASAWLLAFLLCGCSSTTTAVDAGVAASTSAVTLDAGAPPSCASVCQNLRSLDCPAGAPTQEGHTCEEVCANALSGGMFNWDLSCRSSATSCAAVTACK